LLLLSNTPGNIKDTEKACLQELELQELKVDTKDRLEYFSDAVFLAKNPIKGESYMTKAELIDAIAADAKISKAAAGSALDSFIKNVTKALKAKDGKVTLVGFGTFSKAKRAARKGRNPQTGAAIKIKARTVVKFKAGKKLKEAV